MSSTNQFGDLATQLVTESRRSTQTDTLLKYNDPLVRSILREQRQLEQLLESTLADAGDDADAIDPRDPRMAALMVHQTAILRNKRCLLAYHQHRLDKLRDMYWAAGCSLPHLLSASTSSSSGFGGGGGGDVRARVSPHEVDFLKAYNSALVEFRGAFGDELDVAASVTSVPKDLHIGVRVVRDCGVIQTESGAIDFRRGQRFMVRRADVEHLIVQGYLEEV